ncbi:MAG: hypothetical protein ACTSYB_09430 [Candidatus Helarchaeota archaeon]
MGTGCSASAWYRQKASLPSCFHMAAGFSIPRHSVLGWMVP